MTTNNSPLHHEHAVLVHEHIVEIRVKSGHRLLQSEWKIACLLHVGIPVPTRQHPKHFLFVLVVWRCLLP